MTTEDSDGTYVLALQRSLQKFIDTVETLENEDDPSGDGFTREFMVLRELGLKMREDNTFPAEEGKKTHNLKKNRYKDILPFDETRVKLKEIDGEPGSDYINANFIRGHNGCANYIASQGPLPHTVNDFWRMLWAYDIKVIAMACRLVEMGRKKCEQYWPTEVHQTQEFGGVSVTLLSEKDLAEHCTKRILTAKKNGESRTITQFHYTGWPDHDIPNDIDDILEMMAQMRIIKAQDPSVPMVIHCSAGCGRTGTICTIDYAWDVLKSGKLTEDFCLYDIVKEMREQRQSMIQAPEQYKCAHVAIGMFFNKHLQLMEDHIYGNIGNAEDEDDDDYAVPDKTRDPERKVSAIADDIENTIKDLTLSPIDEMAYGDPTPVIVPQPITLNNNNNKPVIKDIKLSPKPELSKKPSIDSTKPAIAKRPSNELSSAGSTPTSPSVKQMVFSVEKIDNIPESSRNPTQKVVHAEKHEVSMNSSSRYQAPIESIHASNVNKTKSAYENTKFVPQAQGQASFKQKPVLERIQSQQDDQNKFKTVIAVGSTKSSAADAKPVISKTVSDPVKNNQSGLNRHSLKSKTLPSSLKSVYEAPQSSIPPSNPTQSDSMVYSFAKDPETASYSVLSTYSSVSDTGSRSGMASTVSSVNQNGVDHNVGGDVYAVVSKSGDAKKADADDVYESLAPGGPTNFKVPPPLPNRNYTETPEEPSKSPGPNKPGGSSEQMNTLGKRGGKLDALKQMFTVKPLGGAGGSESGGAKNVPGFKNRYDQKPSGPRQPPASWITKM